MQHQQKADAADKTAADGKFRVNAPQISLPKGGGAIRGMGEKFSANPVTGAGWMSVPIATSPGRAGFGPQLSLAYDTGADNGPFGFGWNLSIPSIMRKTGKGAAKVSGWQGTRCLRPIGRERPRAAPGQGWRRMGERT